MLERTSAAQRTSLGASAVKRSLDVLVAGVLLVPALPLMLILGLLVRLDSRGPAFYVSERMGRNGCVFRMYKLRTMKYLPAEPHGLPLTHAGDPRTTRIGRVLRRMKMDELPQIFNVIRGDMSLVGPRPEDPFFLPYLGRQAEVLLSCRPGITGPASLQFSNEEALLGDQDTIEHYVDVILPQKVALDLAYINDWRLGADARIIAGTMSMPFRRLKKNHRGKQVCFLDKKEKFD
ncbi:MAG: sugar transferase [Thermoleophilia bacterium]